jgi:hypothetical protein
VAHLGDVVDHLEDVVTHLGMFGSFGDVVAH